MTAKEAYKNSYDIKLRFDFAFLTLTFATLALSIQFSPELGSTFPYLLITSWILLALAGFAGIRRAIKTTQYFDTYAQFLEQIERKTADTTEYTKALDKIGINDMPFWFKIQINCYYLGTICGLAFAAINYVLKCS